MESNDIKKLVQVYRRKISLTDTRFKRYLYNQIRWDARLIGIKGARGVGKTTLLLQYIKEHFLDIDKTILLSLDDIWFTTHDVDDVVDYLYIHGMTTIFFDEVHKCPNWTLRLKNYYDNYPDLHIIYTGSSMLEIDNSKVDLSRRQMLYTLAPMSFREYLEFTGVVTLAPMPLEELLQRHVTTAMEASAQIKILKHFADYLDHGCYPFFQSSGADFHSALASTANLVIEADMPAVVDINYSTVEKTKKLLSIIAQHVPFVPNMAKLAAALECTRDSCLKMLYTLDKAHIITLLTKETKSYKHLVSPEKIFLGNTNLMEALCRQVDVGNQRETLFISQLSTVSSVTAPQQGDFLVGDRLLFEIGGPNKTFEQIKDLPDAYLAIDDIEIGTASKIPLWMFGMLY